MNPETNKLELLNPDFLKELEARKEVRATSGQIREIQAKLTALQQREPHKERWTTFAVGELVDLQWLHENKDRYRQANVKNINANGLLLRGAHLNLSFFIGQEVFVKGEKCQVKHISSKGMYVEGMA